MKTFNSFSFGCRVNLAEKEALDRQLLSKGYIKKDGETDLYILNTCSVTHKAEREAKQHIYRLKRQYPNMKVVVTGCAATNWQKTNTKVEGVDFVVDNTSKEFTAELIEKKYKAPKTVKIDKIPDKILADDKFLRSGRVTLKIQDGCQRFCTYCIVPYLRGLPKSKKIDDLIAFINEHSEYKEVIMTAINTEAFGYDTKEKFINLVSRVLTETNAPRISFGSIHPWSINEEFLNLYKQYANSSRFVHFFHIPLQAGSNNILRMMKRGYTREEFVEKLNKLREMNDLVFIGTDVIVGFLEETDADFEDTYNFMKDTPISKFHVFRFSVRQHTAAFHLNKRLKKPSPEIAQARSVALRKLSQQKYDAFINRHVGKNFEALFMERRDGDYQTALLGNQIPAKIYSENDMTGELKHVKITELKNGSLVGRVV